MGKTQDSGQRTLSVNAKHDTDPSGSGRRRRLRPRAVITGLYGEDALAHMHRWGGTTSRHLALRLGVPKHTADKALRNLYKSSPRFVGLTRVPPDEPSNGGRWQNFWYLTQAGVTYGGSVAGQEIPVVARDSYRRCDQPSKTRHAHARNTFFVMAHADGDRVGAEVPFEAMDGESHRSFPLAGALLETPAGGAGSANDGKAARPAFEGIVPDGTFAVAFEGLPACRFLLEVERGQKYQPRAVRDKIDRYAGLFLRLSEEREKGTRRPRTDGRPHYTAKLLPGGLCPVLVVLDTARKAGLMRDNVLAAATGGDVGEDGEELKRYRAFSSYAKERGFDAGRLFLFAGLDELKERGALAGVYGALGAYDGPRGRDRAPLRAAAVASLAAAEGFAPPGTPNGEGGRGGR